MYQLRTCCWRAFLPLTNGHRGGEVCAENRVKRVMREGGLALVSHVGFADPAVVEIIALSGFDGAFIDMEHSGFDFQTVGEMIRVADLTGVTPIVRAGE